MRMFELRAKTLRDQLPVADFGLEWENRPPINVFERVYPVLKAEKALELTASVYKLDPESLDIEKIRRQQDAMLGDKKETATAPSNAPEGLKTAQRKHKSDLDKEVTSLNKGNAF